MKKPKRRDVVMWWQRVFPAEGGYRFRRHYCDLYGKEAKQIVAPGCLEDDFPVIARETIYPSGKITVEMWPGEWTDGVPRLEAK